MAKKIETVEEMIARLIAEGKNTSEIAELVNNRYSLIMRKKTVERERQNVRSKLFDGTKLTKQQQESYMLDYIKKNYGDFRKWLKTEHSNLFKAETNVNNANS